MVGLRAACHVAGIPSRGGGPAGSPGGPTRVRPASVCPAAYRPAEVRPPTDTVPADGAVQLARADRHRADVSRSRSRPIRPRAGLRTGRGPRRAGRYPLAQRADVGPRAGRGGPGGPGPSAGPPDPAADPAGDGRSTGAAVRTGPPPLPTNRPAAIRAVVRLPRCDQSHGVWRGAPGGPRARGAVPGRRPRADGHHPVPRAGPPPPGRHLDQLGPSPARRCVVVQPRVLGPEPSGSYRAGGVLRRPAARTPTDDRRDLLRGPPEGRPGPEPAAAGRGRRGLRPTVSPARGSHAADHGPHPSPGAQPVVRRLDANGRRCLPDAAGPPDGRAAPARRTDVRRRGPGDRRRHAAGPRADRFGRAGPRRLAGLPARRRVLAELLCPSAPGRRAPRRGHGAVRPSPAGSASGRAPGGRSAQRVE